MQAAQAHRLRDKIAEKLVGRQLAVLGMRREVEEADKARSRMEESAIGPSKSFVLFDPNTTQGPNFYTRLKLNPFCALLRPRSGRAEF